MEKKRYILICANKYDIDEPEFFDTYDDAYKEMKRQYEFFSKDCDCIGKLNDVDAWCMYEGCTTNWKIFDM